MKKLQIITNLFYRTGLSFPRMSEFSNIEYLPDAGVRRLNGKPRFPTFYGANMKASQKVAGNGSILLSRMLEIRHGYLPPVKARCLVYGGCGDAIRYDGVVKKSPSTELSYFPGRSKYDMYAFAHVKARCLVYGDCGDAIRLPFCESIRYG